ncbi:DUF5677 domain-containing protein [Taibaiella chishuiensis]|uniref:Uncharacterized protein n=1 Tax=Taibaiella chishuiensis TaxID=1434707 RepID=A0A2P8D0U0_9BACT|nr:DUF5677 domain-containing protein [Taibaiella chishuiensis]PSK90834.1 hypothetical protein B0I18_107246 [Taibaiella chishuiensis]
MNDIERIRQLDDEIFEEFQKYFEKIESSNFTKLYPKTAIILQLLDIGATFIKNSILDNCETDNYYAVKILYRCLIEHYLKFQFIFTKWGMSKTDDFSAEYLDYSDAREVLDSIKARVSEHQLYDPDYKIANWDSFLTTHPMFKSKTRKQVDIESQKYTFKNVIRFLNEKYTEGKHDLSSHLGKFIIEYSELSSFVHGGTKSYQELMSMQSLSQLEKEYSRISGLALHQSSSIKLFSLLMYIQTDKDLFSKHYFKIDTLIKKL